MLRGSRPGERRGGRKRGTPNRRTVLTDRILSIGLDHPAASQPAILLKLVKDPKLPADTRMAVAPRCYPPRRTRSFRTNRRRSLAGSRTAIAQEALATESSATAFNGSQASAVVSTIRDWNPHALEGLFGVVQDATANPKVRRKAALKIAELLPPKAGKKAKVIPDKYGFSVAPILASGYRDIQLELRSLVNAPSRIIPAIAEKIKKLEARSDAIRRRLQLPCPTKYGDEEAAKDFARLTEFTSLRDNKSALSEAQEAEEAHLKARFDVSCASPESMARHRRKALEDADRRFRMNRLTREFYAPPLSRKDRNDLELLRWLFPKPKRDLPQLDDDRLDPYRDHPFADELIASDGNFYPQDSKLRPAGAPGDLLLEEPKARIYELEKRCGREEMTATEEEELQDLRRRHPRIAEVISQMNLEYDYWFSYELKIAQKAGLDPDAAMKQAEVCCLRFKKDGCLSFFDLVQLRDDGTWPWDPPASPPANNAT
jgi:hypothetical protein